MQKKDNQLLILVLVFVVAFNIIFFMFGAETRNATTWISYAFIHFAYLAMVFTLLTGSADKEHTILNYTIGSVSVVYFLTVFIVGIAFIIVRPANSKIVLTVMVILTALFIILFMVNKIANQKTAVQIEQSKIDAEIFVICKNKMKSISRSISDATLRKKVEMTTDVINGSPIKSNPALYELESQIINMVLELENLVGNNDYDNASHLVDAICERTIQRNEEAKRYN